MAFTLEDNTVLTIERGPMVEEYGDPNCRHTFVPKDDWWWIYKVTFEPFDPARPKHPFPFVMIAPTSDPIQAYQFYVLHGNTLLSKTDPTCYKHHTFCPISKRPPKIFPSDQVGKSTGEKVEPRTLMDFMGKPPTATTFENRPPPKKEEGSALKRKSDTQDQDTSDVGYFSKRKDDDKKGLFGLPGSSTSSTFTAY